MNNVNSKFGISSYKEIPTFAWVLPFIPLGLWLLLYFAVPEPALFYSVNSWAPLAPDAFWGFFVFLGNGWGIFSLCFPLILFAPRLIIAGACAGAAAGVFSRSLKLLIAAPRPPAVLDPETFIIIGRKLGSLAMPSGHAITAFAIATAIFFAIPYRQRKPFWWLFLLAALAGLGRIMVGAHWPADVFAGAAIGIFSGVVGALGSTKIPSKLYEPQSWLMRLVAIMGFVGIVILFIETMDFELNRPYQIVGLVIIFITLIHFIPLTTQQKSETMRTKKPL